MNYPSPRPFRITEADVTGQNFLASPEIPYVRVESERIGERAVRFSVTSAREVGRDFISRAMTYPLGEPDEWKLVEKGLRDISYPSRTIKKLHHSAITKSRLLGLKTASGELADILKATKNTDELREFLKAWHARPDVNAHDLGTFLRAWFGKEGEEFEVPTVNEEYTANIPVFTNLEVIGLAEKFLLDLAPGDIAALLRKKTDDPRVIRTIGMLGSSTDTAIQLPGLTNSELDVIRNAVMRDENRKAWIEIVHQALDKLFIALKEEASFDGRTAKGGGYDGSVYVRREDMPAHLLEKQGDIRILVGKQLRDVEKKTNFIRHQVKFIRRKQITIAHPRVVWVNNNGERHFEYPAGPSEPSFLRPITAKPNSLLGAAVFANLVGMPNVGIDYRHELDRLLGRRSAYAAPLARAGLLGLVLHTKQDELLGYPYFEMIEERALQ